MPFMSRIDPSQLPMPPREKSVSPATLDKARAAFADAERSGKVTWDARLPLGVAVTSALLKRDNHPDGFGYTALFVTGPLVPGGGGDPNKAKEFYVQRDGGFAGLRQLAGPFKLPQGGTKPAVSDETVAKLKTAFQDAQAFGAKWNMGSMPIGQEFVSVELSRDNHPDGFGYTALIPVGALGPRPNDTDPNTVNEFYVQRSGGFAGITQWMGPIQKEPGFFQAQGDVFQS